MTIQFYDVRKKEKVGVPVEFVKKKKYVSQTKAGKTQTRYGLVAEYEGSKLTKFVSESDWTALNAPEV